MLSRFDFHSFKLGRCFGNKILLTFSIKRNLEIFNFCSLRSYNILSTSYNIPDLFLAPLFIPPFSPCQALAIDKS